MKEREYHEHVRQIDLVTPLPQPPERLQHARTLPLRVRRHNDEEACTNRENRLLEPCGSQRKQKRKTRESQEEHNQREPGPLESSQYRRREASPRRHERRQAPKRNRIHAAKIRILLPGIVAVREHRSPKRTKHDEHKQKWNKQPNATQQPRRDRKEKIKHLLDGKRPEHVPIPRQVSASRFENINVKRERRQQRASESPRASGDNEIFQSRIVQHAQNRQQREEQRPDASKSQQIEVANVDTRESAPAFQRNRGNQKSRNRKENLN